VNSLAALAEPTRARVIEAVAERPRTVNDLVELLGVSQPGMSKHLRVLREAGLVRVQPAGQTRVYHLDPAPLKELDRWMDRYRRFWSSKLDALEAHMDEEPE
jgi:DNA-binding transcriptional ArsR family regulator